MTLDWYRGNLPWLKNNTIFLTKSCSQAYGTSTPESDTDYRGVAIPPLPYYYGFLNHFEQAESKGDPDVTVMDIRKFFRLATDCNPNIIELLFTDPSDWVEWSFVWSTIVSRRDLFLSQKARHTFSGYGISQLKRLKLHLGRTPSDTKRGELERRYGYDTKFGMHVVRLLRMGEEILTRGEVIVRRPDAEELLSIRNGAWSFEKLETWALEMDAKIHSLSSCLPKEPDRKALDAMLISVTEQFLVGDAMKILVLDDDIVRHKAFRKKLAGHKVTSVHTAIEAINAMLQHRFDVVLLDHDLEMSEEIDPGCGMDVAEFIQLHLPWEKLPGQVIVHSWNAPATVRMVEAIRSVNIPVVAKAFTSELEWLILPKGE